MAVVRVSCGKRERAIRPRGRNCLTMASEKAARGATLARIAAARVTEPPRIFPKMGDNRAIARSGGSGLSDFANTAEAALMASWARRIFRLTVRTSPIWAQALR